jgi:hypothetical protein
MYPQLSNIEKKIADNLRSRIDTHTATGLSVWMRVFAGADNGLIISSNNNFELFKAAGEGASIYGSPNSVGSIGIDWNGNPVAGGTDRGLRPSPGITSFEVKEGKDQISKEATLGIKCFSLGQMELIQKYFLEPGYTICVEWGWNTDAGGKNMIDTNDKAAGIIKQATERNFNYEKLHEIRLDSTGDYDTFFGFIVGGSVTADGEQWNVDIKLRGAPALPTYLQSQQHIQLQKTNGKIQNSGDSKKLNPYGVSKIEKENSDVKERRWANMFNLLPAHRQIQDVDNYKSKSVVEQFINLDKSIIDAIVSDSNGGFWSFDRPLFGDKGSGSTVTVKGIEVPKEKLWSPHSYIRMDLAIEILNRNGALTSYEFGDKKVSVKIDISKSKIGAFPFMFSTKSSVLVIPGDIPDFRQYFWNAGEVTQEANGVLMVSTKDPTKPISANPIDASINGIRFVEQVPLDTSNNDGDTISEKKGYWGRLKNLYVNFDMFVEKINQPNKTIREVLLDILNEMSAGANEFWNFQIVEQVLKKDDEIIGLKKGDVALTVIDENWIGDNPNKEKTQIFWHSGTLSSFLESTLEIAIPSEMTAQIVSQRLGRATQPSMPHISTAKGGFFESKQDLFSLKPSEITNPKTEKEKEDEAVNAQLEELAKVPLTPEQEANKKIREKKNEIAEAREALAKINEKVQANSNDATTEIRGSGMGQYVVKVDGVDLAAAKKEYADKFKDVTALEAELEAAQNEKWEVERGAYETKQAAISNNLSKIEIVPNPQLLNAPEAMTEKNDLNNPNTFDERFRIYTFDDKSFFDRLKNDVFVTKGGLSHPLPIHYTFKTLGISGIRFGDTFHIRGIPNKYYLNGIFQVQKIEHTLTNMTWTTVITGGFRALQSTISSKTATTSVNSLGNASGNPAAPGGIMSQDAASAIPFSNTSSPKTFKL